MPQKSGSRARAGLKLKMTFCQLHAPHIKSNMATLEMHAGSETSYTYNLRPATWVYFPEEYNYLNFYSVGETGAGFKETHSIGYGSKNQTFRFLTYEIIV